jgi:proteasome lid subunit RPN8/RPN11
MKQKKQELKLGKKNKQKIEAFIRDAYKLENGREICGIIFNNNEIVQVLNCSQTDRYEYVMEPTEQVEAILKHGAWNVVWHTHPKWKAIPSSIDLAYSFIGTYYLIYSGIENNFKLWLRTQNGFKEIGW